MGESRYTLNKENFDKIQEGDIYKNRSLLYYTLFGVKANGGNRKYLDEQAQRYVEYEAFEKGKQKIIITEKYGTPKTNKDKRGGSVGKFSPYIKPLLLDAAPFMKSHKGIIVEIYDLVDEAYFDIHKLHTNNLWYYEETFISTLRSATNNALNGLEKEGAITYTYYRYKNTDKITVDDYIRNVHKLEANLDMVFTPEKELENIFNADELLKANIKHQHSVPFSEMELAYIAQKRNEFCVEKKIINNKIYYSNYRDEYAKYLNLQIGYIGIFDTWQMFDVRTCSYFSLSKDEQVLNKDNLKETLDYTMYCKIMNNRIQYKNSLFNKGRVKKVEKGFSGYRRARLSIDDIERRNWFKDKEIKKKHCILFRYNSFDDVKEKYHKRYEENDKIKERNLEEDECFTQFDEI